MLRYTQIDTLRKIIDAGQNLAAVDVRTAAANEMNRPLVLVVGQKLQHDAARRCLPLFATPGELQVLFIRHRQDDALNLRVVE